MKIEVLGTGCPKCETLANNTQAAVAALGIEAEIVKVSGINEMTSRGIMLPPALIVDGEVKISGKVPTVDDIKSMLS